MTVMCELHSMLKELKAAADRAATGDLWQTVMRGEMTPLPPDMFDPELEEQEKNEGLAKKSPKKSGGRGTLRGMSTSTPGASGSQPRKKSSPFVPTHPIPTESTQNPSGLQDGATRTAQGDSAEDSSPPPPPPSDSASPTNSSIPPPPIRTDSQSASGTSSSVPPPPSDEVSASTPPPPPPAEPSPLTSLSYDSISAEPADAETFVATAIDPQKRRKSTVSGEAAQDAKKAVAAAANAQANPQPPAKTTAAAIPTQAPKTEQLQPPTATAVLLSPSAGAKKTAAPTPKLITHELPSSFTKITKEDIVEETPTETSALSRLLGPGEVEVWVPGAKSTITVSILPTASMQQLIIKTIKTYNTSLTAGGVTKPEKPLDTNPDAYNIRIALPDGQIDDMFPILAKKGLVDQWAEVAFILVDNPNFVKTAATSVTPGSDRKNSGDLSAGSSSSTTGQPGAGAAGPNGGTADSRSHHHRNPSMSGTLKDAQNATAAALASANPGEGGGGGGGGGGVGAPTAGGGGGMNPSTGATGSPNPEKVIVRVTLPTGAYHTLPAEPSMKLSKLLALICEKRKMIASHYTLTTLQKEYLSQNSRIQDLKELHLVLEAKAVDSPLGPPSAEEVFYNDNVAAQYKVFQNIVFHIKNRKKFNTGNSKQEPVSLAIDGTKFEITFSKRGSTASSSTSGSSTSREGSMAMTHTFAYAISDLKSVQHTEESMFVIDTIKEKDRLIFEASSKAFAVEITSKVSYLIEMVTRDPKQSKVSLDHT